jgi:YbbR domain-containing protein
MRDFFGHNLALKLISLGLAIGLWQVVRHDPAGEIALDVPIEFRNMPENMEISTENIPGAEIRLSGPDRLLRNLSRAEVHAVIDVGALRPGERTFDLSAAEIRVPRGLEIVQVVPSQLRLDFDLRISKKVAVHPRVLGDFAPGYQIGRIKVDPAEIYITGPRKRVEGIEAAITDAIDASGTTSQATFVRHAYVSDPLVQVTDPNPVRVTVMMNRGSAEAEQR